MKDNKERKWNNITKIILSMPDEFTLTTLMERIAKCGIENVSTSEIQKILYFYQDENIIECRGYVYSLKPYLK